MMQISKVSSSNEPGTEHLLLGASITLATRSKYHTCYLCLFASYTYKRNSIIVFRMPMLVYLDVRGVEISLLSTVSISNCRYQEAPGEVVWSESTDLVHGNFIEHRIWTYGCKRGISTPRTSR